LLPAGTLKHWPIFRSFSFALWLAIVVGAVLADELLLLSLDDDEDEPHPASTMPATAAVAAAAFHENVRVTCSPLVMR
jgi:hypothetical protein